MFLISIHLTLGIKLSIILNLVLLKSEAHFTGLLQLWTAILAFLFLTFTLPQCLTDSNLCLKFVKNLFLKCKYSLLKDISLISFQLFNRKLYSKMYFFKKLITSGANQKQLNFWVTMDTSRKGRSQAHARCWALRWIAYASTTCSKTMTEMIWSLLCSYGNWGTVNCISEQGFT